MLRGLPPRRTGADNAMKVIIGAGLTGLAAARYLRGSCRVYEKEQDAGGLCRSVVADGFTFDYTGHLLHLRDASLRRRIMRMLPDTFENITRNAAVYCCGTFLPYPFQANLYGLPREVVAECLTSFVRACRTGKKTSARNDFRDWVTGCFGESIARLFFIPYNEKLWQSDLRELTSEWAGWSVPRPSLDEVVRGALGITATGMGYNATFLYPRAGGIGVLPEALCRGVRSVAYGKELASVNLADRTVGFADGESVAYEHLVSTIPLPDLLGRVEDLPRRYRDTARGLRYVSVHNLNIGINRERITPYHWIYFPEHDFPFYRVGCYTNFTPAMAPRGTSSLYIEISAKPDTPVSFGHLLDASLEGLHRCGIMKKGDRIVSACFKTIPHAYVLYDRFRERRLPRIMTYLASRNVTSAGRYGGWEYSSMEDALHAGMHIADRLSAG